MNKTTTNPHDQILTAIETPTAIPTIAPEVNPLLEVSLKESEVVFVGPMVAGSINLSNKVMLEGFATFRMSNVTASSRSAALPNTINNMLSVIVTANFFYK